MKHNRTIIISLVIGFLWSPLYSISAKFQPEGNKYKTISAIACDSLIKANAKNPDFVILDVRTPDVWKAEHLTGSINRNYYDADFEAQLNALPKKKLFLLHCQSGGRSAPTLAKMKTLNFAEVYEMSSGINAWKARGLPTTNLLAPKIMLVSNGGIQNGTFEYGIADSLKITLTNRANDTLKFASIALPVGNEFSSDFDRNRKLKGSEDYTFSVFYKPQNLARDSVKLDIQSNGGPLSINFILKNVTLIETQNQDRERFRIFPNPATSFISVQNLVMSGHEELSIVDINGRIVRREYNLPADYQIRVSDLPEGFYFVRIVSSNQIFMNRFVVRR